MHHSDTEIRCFRGRQCLVLLGSAPSGQLTVTCPGPVDSALFQAINSWNTDNRRKAVNHDVVTDGEFQDLPLPDINLPALANCPQRLVFHLSCVNRSDLGAAYSRRLFHEGKSFQPNDHVKAKQLVPRSQAHLCCDGCYELCTGKPFQNLPDEHLQEKRRVRKRKLASYHHRQVLDAQVYKLAHLGNSVLTVRVSEGLCALTTKQGPFWMLPAAQELLSKFLLDIKALLTNASTDAMAAAEELHGEEPSKKHRKRSAPPEQAVGKGVSIKEKGPLPHAEVLRLIKSYQLGQLGIPTLKLTLQKQYNVDLARLPTSKHSLVQYVVAACEAHEAVLAQGTHGKSSISAAATQPNRDPADAQDEGTRNVVVDEAEHEGQGGVDTQRGAVHANQSAASDCGASPTDAERAQGTGSQLGKAGVAILPLIKSAGLPFIVAQGTTVQQKPYALLWLLAPTVATARTLASVPGQCKRLAGVVIDCRMNADMPADIVLVGFFSQPLLDSRHPRFKVYHQPADDLFCGFQFPQHVLPSLGVCKHPAMSEDCVYGSIALPAHGFTASLVKRKKAWTNLASNVDGPVLVVSFVQQLLQGCSRQRIPEGEGEVADKPCTLEAQDLLRGLAGEPVDKLGGTPQQGLKVLASTASIRTPVSQLAALQRPTRKPRRQVKAYQPVEYSSESPYSFWGAASDDGTQVAPGRHDTTPTSSLSAVQAQADEKASSLTGPPLLCDVLAAIGRMHGGYKSADPDGNCQMNSTSILERYDELGFPAAAQRRSITLQGNASQHRQVMASVLSHNGALKAMLRKDAFGVLKHCPGLKTEYDRLLRRRRLTDKLLSDDMKQELVVEAFEKAIAGMIVKGSAWGTAISLRALAIGKARHIVVLSLMDDKRIRCILWFPPDVGTAPDEPYVWFPKSKGKVWLPSCIFDPNTWVVIYNGTNHYWPACPLPELNVAFAERLHNSCPIPVFAIPAGYMDRLEN